MAFVVRAYPLLERKEGDFRQLAEKLAGEKLGQANDFYTSYGVRREQWHLQDGQVIVVTELDEPEDRAADYSASQKEFDVWLKDQVHDLTGVDPNQDPLGPPSEMVFEWKCEEAWSLGSVALSTPLNLDQAICRCAIKWEGRFLTLGGGFR